LLKQIKKSQRLHGFKADMLRPYTFILRRRNGININFSSLLDINL
jgi:hypothetical protein